jgi:hypothetical protein
VGAIARFIEILVVIISYSITQAIANLNHAGAIAVEVSGWLLLKLNISRQIANTENTVTTPIIVAFLHSCETT